MGGEGLIKKTKLPEGRRRTWKATTLDVRYHFDRGRANKRRNPGKNSLRKAVAYLWVFHENYSRRRGCGGKRRA